MAAAHELVRHLAATAADRLSEDSPLMVLARAGALALMSRIETDPSVGTFGLTERRAPAK